MIQSADFKKVCHIPSNTNITFETQSPWTHIFINHFFEVITSHHCTLSLFIGDGTHRRFHIAPQRCVESGIELDTQRTVLCVFIGGYLVKLSPLPPLYWNRLDSCASPCAQASFARAQLLADASQANSFISF